MRYILPFVGRGAPAYDPTTKLHMHFDGANNSTTFTDSSPSNVSFTSNGSPIISTTKSKFGGSSYKGDGACHLNGTVVTPGSGDFCMEGWWSPGTGDNAAEGGMFSLSSTAGGLGAASASLAAFVSGNFFGMYAGGAYQAASIASVDNPTNFYHVALFRSSGTVYLTIDGALACSVADSTNYTTYTNLAIGGYFSTSFRTRGYVDELRYRVGSTPYTGGGFTPPSSAFTS